MLALESLDLVNYPNSDSNGLRPTMRVSCGVVRPNRARCCCGGMEEKSEHVETVGLNSRLL